MTTWEYITKISAAGREQHRDTVLGCMDFYGVDSTQELTLAQVTEYWQRMQTGGKYRNR